MKDAKFDIMEKSPWTSLHLDASMDHRNLGWMDYEPLRMAHIMPSRNLVGAHGSGLNSFRAWPADSKYL